MSIRSWRSDTNDDVLRVNPAKALYERLGFREVGGDEFRFFMEWQQPARAALRAGDGRNF